MEQRVKKLEEHKKSMNKKLMMAGIGTAAILCVGLLILLLLHPWEVKLAEAYSVSIGSEETVIGLGETLSLEPLFTVLDEKKANRAEKELEETVVVWTSSDETVATVSDEGKVTAKGPGTATITVTAGELTAQCQISVYIPLKALLLSETEITVNVGDRVPLSWQRDPADAELAAEAVWESSDEAVAVVDGKGRVSALMPGTVEITVGIGDIEAVCKVTVLAPIKEISLSERKLELIDGETAQLSVAILPEYTTEDTTAVWTSSDETVAVVDENGGVTATGPGQAVISVTVGQFTKTCEVNVTAPLTDFRFHFESLTLRNGDSTTLPVSYAPANTTDELNITWSSSNENVATVNGSGVVTAVNSGTAIIRATCGRFSTECKVTVVIPVNKVYISQSEAVMDKGDTLSLTAWVGPSNTTEDRSISWTSDNAKVATVKNGVVTAVGPGTARIIASHNDFSAVCTVTVYSPMTGIEIEQDSLSIIEGYGGRLSVVFYPADTTDSKDRVWTSSDESIAVVRNGMVEGKAVGTCVITVTCGEFTATCPVTVQPYVEVESITLNVDSYDFEEIGKTFQLVAAVLPEDASFGDVSFHSGDTSVASVSATGLVTAVGEGETVITATAGGKKYHVTVTVPKPDVVIVLDPGHGGKYPGAIHNGYTERDLNLKVALYCREYLEANYTGMKVYLTREGDYHLNDNLSIDLEARAQFAQDVGADILVSLHFNASHTHNVGGCMAMISKQANVSAQSKALADSMLKEVAKLGLYNRGTWSGNSEDYFDQYGNPLDYYAINRHCANRGIPGIIMEHCFMDYQPDLKYLSSDEALKKLAIADAIGIANYLGLEKK